MLTPWQEIIKQTEELLEKWKHPDPYRAPTAPGGSKYERNLPAPYTEREYILDRTHVLHSDMLLRSTAAYAAFVRWIPGGNRRWTLYISNKRLLQTMHLLDDGPYEVIICFNACEV